MRVRLRSFFALFGVVAISAVGLVALAPAAVADSIGPVDASIPDGDAGALRDVLGNQVGDGDTVVVQAGATYQLTCNGGGDLETSAFVIVQGNGATIEQTCDELVWDASGDLTLDSLTITGGFDDDDRPAGGIHFDGEELIITNSSIVDNATCGDGGGINMDGGDLLHIENSTIAGNSAGTEGGAISSHSDSEATFEIINSTITDNNADVGGAIFNHDGSPLTLVYVTMASNAADSPGPACELSEGAGDDAGASATEGDVDALANGTAANIEFDEADSILTTFGSVIALPIEGPNCNVEVDVAPAAALGNTVSNGYNYSDDESCDLTGTGDRQGAADPQLLALGANGGPTLTRAPAEGSPLIDGVALDACHPDGITTDQRGVVRPQRTACDVGAGELEARTPTRTPTPEPAPAAIVTPRFTG
jgi:hypothetical protein